MATVQLKLGPADHGRRLHVDDFESAEYVGGFRYEIIDGRLYVSPMPNFPESYLETWLLSALNEYADSHPELIGYIATKGRVFLPKRKLATVPEPDIAVYTELPRDVPLRKIRWQDLNPFLVVEVLVDGDIGKDITRNPALFITLPSIKEYWVLNGAESPDEPSLIQHRRRGKSWTVTTFPYGSTFTTKLLPGFELLIDPRK